MAFLYEVDVPATVATCRRESCGKRFIQTVASRDYCSGSCRTMVWQGKNPEVVKRNARDNQKRYRERLREMKDRANRAGANGD